MQNHLSAGMDSPLLPGRSIVVHLVVPISCSGRSDCPVASIIGKDTAACRGGDLRTQNRVKTQVNIEQQTATATHLPHRSSVKLNGASDIFLNHLLACALAAVASIPVENNQLNACCFNLAFLSVMLTGMSAAGTSRNKSSIRKSS